MPSVHAQFVGAAALSGCTSTAPRGRNGGLEEGETNSGIHDYNKIQRGEVDVSKKNRGVDFTHLLTGPILPAPVERAGLAPVVHNYSYCWLFCDLQHHPRWTHDEQGQDPDDDNDHL